ncbi:MULTISPECIES: hypothetical protein [unclassified Haladaptatus]|uniref:DUF7501 family protein n=1 Tax=unclassified Haladaptatus TaxID=2622732 RepID=UPI0023E89BC9|nr:MULTISPECIES: hypothetical protein [unclassified Haladaptatus]
MAASETWTDPYVCPFCRAQLASPGEGFITHIEQTPDCETAFETWRDCINEDITGGWAG